MLQADINTYKMKAIIIILMGLSMFLFGCSTSNIESGYHGKRTVINDGTKYTITYKIDKNLTDKEKSDIDKGLNTIANFYSSL